MIRYLVSATIGMGAAITVNAIDANYFREEAPTMTPAKVEVALKDDEKPKLEAKVQTAEVKETYDPRYDIVATVLAQRGWICGKVVTVRPVKGNRYDLVHFTVTCLQVYEKDGGKLGTLRVYMVTADREVVQSILDNKMPDRKGLVLVDLIKREEYSP